jgi:hypothetical protein
MSTIGQFYSRIISTNWTPEAITAAGTVALACLTFILAFGTIFLWRATIRLVNAERNVYVLVITDRVYCGPVLRVAPAFNPAGSPAASRLANAPLGQRWRRAAHRDGAVQRPDREGQWTTTC